MPSPFPSHRPLQPGPASAGLRAVADWLLGRPGHQALPATPLDPPPPAQPPAQQQAWLQALVRSEERLRLAEHVAQLGSFDWNPGTGALHWSDEHFRLWGHAPGALRPDYAAFCAGVHPDDLAMVQERLHHALRTGSRYECSHRVCRPDGTVIDVLALGEVTLDGTGTAQRMLGTVQDVSRRRAEEAHRQQQSARLEASLDNLRMTLNATGDAIFASDAAGPGEPLLFVNDRMLQMWGIPPAQAATLTPAGVLAAATPLFFDPARELARIAEVIASGTVQEDRLSLTDGRVLLRRCVPTQVAGRQVRVWGFRDISEEARAQATVRAAEAQQRALLAAFPGHIACIDAGLRLRHVNARLAALLGSTVPALLGQSAALLAEPGGETALAQQVAMAMDGTPVRFERLHPATADRPAVHVLYTLAPGLDSATGAPQCHVFGTDITPQKQVEAALVAARDEAQRASRAKSDFLSRMSHELRTPMHSVLGFAQLLQADRQNPLAPHQQAQLGEIMRSGRQLLSLIDALLDSRRFDAGAHNAAGHGAAPAAPSAAPSPSAAPAAPAAPAPPAGAGPAPAGPPDAGAANTQPPRRVLYIDDNPVNTLLMAAMFERLPGLLLHCELDPQQGVAQALADPPALLLVDIQMPVMDGFQVLRLLRADARTQAVPAIAVSANAMPQDLARGQAAGFADYLTKPLELPRLVAALRTALPGWTADPG